ncbi:hypothetical protein EYF80_026264 [Liparis tanakae]|uniref:Uncharacterized protein n=1 Tax=Liparis tanakae TaxID=230148 RepID=A0A4Z2HFE8_9TELE|nr:hypothetical protein EYF80_026264 [Liparis tanakae]
MAVESTLKPSEPGCLTRAMADGSSTASAAKVRGEGPLLDRLVVGGLAPHQAEVKGQAGVVRTHHQGGREVGEQLRHVVVAGELPETGFEVEVPVEAQCAVPPQSAAELIGRRVARALGAPRRGGDEAVACGDLIVVEQVGAAVVSDPGSVRTQGQFKVHERASGDHRQHACKGRKGRQCDATNGARVPGEMIYFKNSRGKEK